MNYLKKKLHWAMKIFLKLSRFKKQKKNCLKEKKKYLCGEKNTAQKENIPTSYLFKDKYLKIYQN